MAATSASASPTPRIGLDLSLTEAEIERELRRSIGNEISEKDLKTTIILNAKTLIEKDADFAKFAGRILLSYIYEEVLDWNIVARWHRQAEASPQARLQELPQARRRHRAPQPELLELQPRQARRRPRSRRRPGLRLPRHPDALRPLPHRRQNRQQADRRIETPQFFWMRVAMGLFIEGGNRPRGLGHPPLQSLQGPPLLLLHADALQLRHAAQPALLLLPLQGR